MATREISVREVIDGVAHAVLVEDYPAYARGPCCLALQRDRLNRPIHVVWGLHWGHDSCAVIVTAYRPDPQLWDETWRQRRR